MLNMINDIINDFMAFTQNNPVISGVVSLWGLGIITYVFREIPKKLVKLIKRQLTVELEMLCRDEIFFHFLAWYEKAGYGEKARSLRLNDAELTQTKSILSAGFGTHYFFFKGYPFKLERIKEERGTYNIKESITLTTIGRSQKPMLDLLKTITPIRDRNKNTRIFVWEDEWVYSHEQPVRDFQTIILGHKTRHKIQSHFEKFKQDKEWYLDHGIPYKTGLCLYGPPGTGKTSLIRALAGLEGKDLYVLNLMTMNDKNLQKALDKIKENAIVLIEDIDTVSATNTRETDKETKTSFLTLSGILNAIDGVFSATGRILIITTNHLNKLDPALIRPGRIDLCLELGYMTNEMLEEAMFNFFPNYQLGKCNVRPNLTPAQFQNIVSEFKNNPEKVFELVTVPEMTINDEVVAISG